MKNAVQLFIGAIVVMGLGGYAYFSAPPEANRITAVAIPGFIAVVFALLGIGAASRAKSGRERPILIGACVAAMVFAGLVAFPAVMRTRKMTNWPGANLEWQQEVQRDPQLGERAASDRSVRKKFFDERNSPDHDQRYLVITLWSISAACLLTGLSMLAGAKAARGGRGARG